MLHVRRIINESELAAKQAISRIDVDFANLPIPLTVDTKKSAGELLSLATRGPINVDPITNIKAVKSKVSARLKAARQPLEEAEQVAIWLNKAANFLLDDDRLPPAPAAVPPHIVANLDALKTFARAGLVSPNEIAGKINRAASDALTDITKAKAAFKRFFSTASVASVNKGAAYAEACGRSYLAEGMRKSLAARRTRHNKTFGRHQDRRG